MIFFVEFEFLRIFSYTSLWFIGKGQEEFHRIEFLCLNFTGKYFIKKNMYSKENDKSSHSS